MRPIGARWRELREDLDLHTDQVAPSLRISAGTLKNIESQQPRALVSNRLAKRAARYFNVDISELVEPVNGDGLPDEPPTKKQDDETNRGPGRKTAEEKKTSRPKRPASRDAA